MPAGLGCPRYCFPPAWTASSPERVQTGTRTGWAVMPTCCGSPAFLSKRGVPKASPESTRDLGQRPRMAPRPRRGSCRTCLRGIGSVPSGGICWRINQGTDIGRSGGGCAPELFPRLGRMLHDSEESTTIRQGCCHTREGSGQYPSRVPRARRNRPAPPLAPPGALAPPDCCPLQGRHRHARHCH